MRASAPRSCPAARHLPSAVSQSLPAVLNHSQRRSAHVCCSYADWKRYSDNGANRPAPLAASAQPAAAEPRSGAAAPSQPPSTPQPPSSSENDTSTQPKQEESVSKYSWTRCWWPVAAIETLAEERPTAFTILGKDLVVFRDGKQQWRVLEDRCPHRLAALSEGIG